MAVEAEGESARRQSPGAAPEASDEYLVNSLVRGLELLQCFTREQPSLSLPEIAERTGLNRTTAFRFVYTLRHLGFLDFEADTRRYRLGPKVLTLGFEFLNGLSLIDRALPFLRSLRDAVDESVHLGILSDDAVVYVARVPAERVVNASVGVGSRLPAATTSMGRVLLAHLPREQQEAILARADLRPRTPYSVHDPQSIWHILQQVRQQGWVVSEQEYEVGVSSVAAPVRDAAGHVVAAINVSGPSARLTRDVIRRRIVPAIQRASVDLSAALGAPASPDAPLVAAGLNGRLSTRRVRG